MISWCGNRRPFYPLLRHPSSRRTPHQPTSARRASASHARAPVCLRPPQSDEFQIILSSVLMKGFGTRPGGASAVPLAAMRGGFRLARISNHVGATWLVGSRAWPVAYRSIIQLCSVQDSRSPHAGQTCSGLHTWICKRRPGGGGQTRDCPSSSAPQAWREERHSPASPSTPRRPLPRVQATLPLLAVKTCPTVLHCTALYGAVSHLPY
jgi:hypothetical protein